MRQNAFGFSLLEMAMVLVILSVLATVLIPLASGLIDNKRANDESSELQAMYKAIVGDPKSNTFGYLGDVGAYPASLLDLVQLPASNPPGWNGPYINAVRIDSGILYDRFGGALEYFQPAPPALPSSVLDQLALISKGPDRYSTNTATNPNQSSSFGGTLPSNPTYSSGTGNADNVVYPAFLDNSSVLNYVSLGQVNFNIRDFDEAAAVNGMVYGCPGLYDIVITSVSRGVNEAYMTYQPGGASVDLLQGLYSVKVFVTGSHYPVLQEQVSVVPGTVLTRDYSLPGVNSSLAGTVSFTVTNQEKLPLIIYADGSSIGGAVVSGRTVTKSINPCAMVQVQQSTSVFDNFVMPNLAITKTYSPTPATAYTLTVQNSGTYTTLAVYDAGLLVGTVTSRSNRRVKSFSLSGGDTITIKDQNNVQRDSFTLSATTTKTY